MFIRYIEFEGLSCEDSFNTNNATNDDAVNSLRRHAGFRCPKNVRGQRTGGCGALNAESAQRCSECDLLLWESVEVNG